MKYIVNIWSRSGFDQAFIQLNPSYFMAKIRNGLLGMISGKLGSMVVVTRGTTTYVRSVPKYTDQSWSEKQLQLRQRFKAVSLFSQEHKRGLIWPIWNLAPGKASGYHRFVGANIGAFDLDGRVKDRALVRFSDGTLPAPIRVKAERLPGEIRITWENEATLPRTRLSDQLWYMAVADGETTPGGDASGTILTGPVFTGPHKTTIQRGTKEAVIPDADGQTRGLYLFFAAADRKAFSPDRYVEV